MTEAITKIVADFKTLADDFQKLADAIAEKNPTVESTETEPTPIPEQTYTLEDVRSILAEKSQQGHTAEVKALIQKFGGNRLSDINPDNYADIIKEAELLG